MQREGDKREHGKSWHNWDVHNYKNGWARDAGCGQMMVIQKSRRALKVVSREGLIRFPLQQVHSTVAWGWAEIGPLPSPSILPSSTSQNI